MSLSESIAQFESEMSEISEQKKALKNRENKITKTLKRALVNAAENGETIDFSALKKLDCFSSEHGFFLLLCAIMNVRHLKDEEVCHAVVMGLETALYRVAGRERELNPVIRKFLSENFQMLSPDTKFRLSTYPNAPHLRRTSAAKTFLDIEIGSALFVDSYFWDNHRDIGNTYLCVSADSSIVSIARLFRLGFTGKVRWFIDDEPLDLFRPSDSGSFVVCSGEDSEPLFIAEASGTVTKQIADCFKYIVSGNTASLCRITR